MYTYTVKLDTLSVKLCGIMITIGYKDVPVFTEFYDLVYMCVGTVVNGNLSETCAAKTVL